MFDDAMTVVHSFVTSRFDNGNAFLAGFHKNQIQKLQIQQLG